MQVSRKYNKNLSKELNSNPDDLFRPPQPTPHRSPNFTTWPIPEHMYNTFVKLTSILFFFQTQKKRTKKVYNSAQKIARKAAWSRYQASRINIGSAMAEWEVLRRELRLRHEELANYLLESYREVR